ncbi:hypothetical protein H2199_006630 [Coniosporium tulheliwenetii]|uniref:Uncharacterized protein n=1 Tax=Coniosporium tulheliwenetii TaxID=3383036 RepID=A0ACC2YU37_9PEZI|nr:hypothetical protein H2199_006630 [Cladosporium sp. JES 115]
MYKRHLGPPAQALYRVFVQPALSAPLPRPIRPCPPTIPRALLAQVRHAGKYRPPVARTQKYDEEIGSAYINLVDDSGTFHQSIRMRDVLRDFNRDTHHLVAVSPADPNDPSSLPTCKILSKESLREAERVKLKPKKTVADLMKQLELNWAIDANDLNHRLKKMGEFLAKGMRVEVATAAEIEDVVKKVRSAAAESKGRK